MKQIAFLIIIIFVICSRLCLVSNYAGDVDPSLYSISYINMVRDGGANLLIFNYEMSFGYYWLLSVVDKLVQHDIAKLIVTQNYINAVSGIFIILLFGLLARRLTNAVVAIFGMVILALDHSLWNWSLYAYPGVISIAFFILSLYLFDKGIKEIKDTSEIACGKSISLSCLTLSGLAGLAALVFRVDILFVFANYLLIYKYRSKKIYSKKNILIFYILMLFTYLVLRHFALEDVRIYDGGTISNRVDRLFNFWTITSSLVINFGSTMASIGIIFFIVAAIAMFLWARKHLELLPALVLTLAPVFIMVFFEHMDLARYSLVIHPLLAFFAALAFKKIFSSTKNILVWGIGTIIVAYILQTALVYSPLKNKWSQKFPPKSSAPFVVRPLPIGNFFSDRKNRWEDEKNLYQHALYLSKQSENYLVICSRLHSYRMALLLHQLSPEAVQKNVKGSSIIELHGSRSISVNNYHIINCASRDTFNLYNNITEYNGYKVYFLKNLQFPYLH